MKPPVLADDAFLADVATVRSPPGARPAQARLDLWWLGQSGFLVHFDQHFLLLDPYLSDSLTRKYAATDKPHVRMTGRVIDPARLDFISVVTSSHAHTDHLDPETLQPLAAGNPGLRIVCPEATRRIVCERSGLSDDRILGMDVPLTETSGSVPTTGSSTGTRPMSGTSGRPLQLSGTPFSITAIPAAHERLDRDAQGRLLYLGFILQAGPFRVYHSGDTVLFDGLAETLRPFAVDLALLPINGRAPERRVAGNLWGREAAQLAHVIGARTVVPCHYDMFDFNTATPEEFIEECRRLRQPFQVPGQGSRITLHPSA